MDEPGDANPYAAPAVSADPARGPAGKVKALGVVLYALAAEQVILAVVFLGSLVLGAGTRVFYVVVGLASALWFAWACAKAGAKLRRLDLAAVRALRTINVAFAGLLLLYAARRGTDGYLDPLVALVRVVMVGGMLRYLMLGRGVEALTSKSPEPRSEPTEALLAFGVSAILPAVYIGYYVFKK